MIREIEHAGCLDGAVAVWSMWPGYLERPGQESLLNFLERHSIPLVTHHASGHAYLPDLQRLARAPRADSSLDSFDEQVLDPISTGMGESMGALSQGLTRLRSTRFGVSMVAALAVIAVLLAASVLAATGHFPVTTQ
jgi:hypothetical protein